MRVHETTHDARGCEFAAKSGGDRNISCEDDERFTTTPLEPPERAMPSGRIADRVASIAPSATLAVTNKANQLRAAGEPVIGFG
ncbi:MAG: hypothetical protein ACR2QO_24855, partial [Acidimicrobiales bacterium]